MQEERRPLDPTRKLLKVFGVKVTDYEDRTAAILEQASALRPGQTPELVRLAMEAVELTANMNVHLREMSGHVLSSQARVLAELKTALERAAT